jgi:hypothetical protein
MLETEILVVSYSSIKKFYHQKFIAENSDLYDSNSEIHDINTRFSSDLNTATANLTTF